MSTVPCTHPGCGNTVNLTSKKRTCAAGHPAPKPAQQPVAPPTSSQTPASKEELQAAWIKDFDRNRMDLRTAEALDCTVTVSFLAACKPDQPFEQVRERVHTMDNLADLVINYDPDLPDAAKQKINDFLSTADPKSYLDEGTQRIVLDDGNQVLKVAKTLSGLRANYYELTQSSVEHEGYRNAHTTPTEWGLAVISAEKVEGPPGYVGSNTETTRQIRVVSAGERVCFDYGGNIRDQEEYAEEADKAINEWLQNEPQPKQKVELNPNGPTKYGLKVEPDYFPKRMSEYQPAEIEHVDPTTLVATQDWFKSKPSMKKLTPPGHKPIHVYEHPETGVRYIGDGHHRAAAHAIEGKPIKVRVHRIPVADN